MRRGLYVLLSALLLAPVGARQVRTDSFELNELTVAQLQDGLATGRYTSRRLVDLYLARVEEIDRAGPALRSIIQINPDARPIADALDAEWRERGPRGPLHGIPVVIKDNIDTADRMMTTAGSLALEGSIAARDAFVVQRLRAAGAVILGKTNMSEWANFRSTRSTSGWSGRGGLVRNPYILDRNACGSSSGTGAAVAASLAAAGVGTVIARYKLDALVAPTGGPAWTTDLVNGDHFPGASSTPAAVAGYPSITVPAGAVYGLPVGISFIGGAWSESRLIALAYAYEQASRLRRAPEFLPTLTPSAPASVR